MKNKLFIRLIGVMLAMVCVGIGCENGLTNNETTGGNDSALVDSWDSDIRNGQTLTFTADTFTITGGYGGSYTANNGDISLTFTQGTSTKITGKYVITGSGTDTKLELTGFETNHQLNGSYSKSTTPNDPDPNDSDPNDPDPNDPDPNDPDPNDPDPNDPDPNDPDPNDPDPNDPDPNDPDPNAPDPNDPDPNDPDPNDPDPNDPDPNDPDPNDPDPNDPNKSLSLKNIPIDTTIGVYVGNYVVNGGMISITPIAGSECSIQNGQGSVSLGSIDAGDYTIILSGAKQVFSKNPVTINAETTIIDYNLIEWEQQPGVPGSLIPDNPDNPDVPDDPGSSEPANLIGTWYGSGNYKMTFTATKITFPGNSGMEYTTGSSGDKRTITIMYNNSPAGSGYYHISTDKTTLTISGFTGTMAGFNGTYKDTQP